MYKIDQSPLYKLSSKKRLATLLHSDLATLRSFTRNTEVNYDVFCVGRGEKPRAIQAPRPCLKNIHQRLFELLKRIEFPDYLHSGVTGRSYITNAEAHKGSNELFKLDIKSFFPSVEPSNIFFFFNSTLKCSPDVSEQLRAICSYGDRLPTGSCISQIIAFYAYKPMFDALQGLAGSRSLTMTCYVDDVTFSGQNISKGFQYEATREIQKTGLVAHKKAFFGRAKRKLVTGVIVDGNQCRVRNSQKLKMHQLLNQYNGAPPGKERDKLLDSLLGRYGSAGMIESKFNVLSKQLRGKR